MTRASGFADRLVAAAREELEDGDDVVEVGPALPGPCDAVTFLPGRTVVAADVDEDWVTAQLRARHDGPPETRSVGLGRFVAAMVERLGHPAASVGILTAAVPRAAMLRGGFAEIGGPDASWAAYRTEVRTHRFTDHGLAGSIDVGRGPGGRWDTGVRPDRDTGGEARQLLAAALTLIPRDAVLFGSAPVHDVGALRTMLGGGFRPVGLELLLLTRPGQDTARATESPAASSSSSSSSPARPPGRLARLFGARG